MIRIGDTFHGRYEILKEIGHGGMSTVYLAMDNNMNKQWAVKEIRRSGRDANDDMYSHSLQAEANMMKGLDHGALPHIQDIIDEGATFCVVMDYIEGESLDKILNEYGPQPEQQVLEWAMQICDVLSYLHGQRPPIIYRDMKPGNVMLKPDGNIKIIDFGIAREYKQNSADTTVLGTRGFAPPEQYNGRTDPRSDIYALGMTMHNLLTGLDPRAKDYEYHPVRYYNMGISDGVEAIIEKCVQPAAENRYQSCADLMYDLQHPELVTKGHKRKQRARLGLFIATLTVSLACLAGALITKQQSNSIYAGQYESLIKASNVETIVQGIAIYPTRTDGIESLINCYDENFSVQDGMDQFGLLQNAYGGTTFAAFEANEENTPDGLVVLNYNAGKLYFSYYKATQTQDGVANATITGERINKAYAYFKQNHDYVERLGGETALTTAEAKQAYKTSEYFYNICNFYKKYLLKTGSTEAPSKLEYEELLDTMGTVLDTLEADTYCSLSLYSTFMNILHDRSNDMAYNGVEEARVTGLMETIYNRAKNMGEQNNTVFTNLRNSVLNSYEPYAKDVAATYSVHRRGEG